MLPQRTSPGSHRHLARGHQGGLAEGCWGALADAGGPSRWGFTLDWLLSGKGRGLPPSGVFTNLVCPEGHRQRGHSCSGRGSGRTCSWDRGGLVAFVAWTMPARCPCSRSTGEHCQGCWLLLGDNVRGQKPTTPSWSLWLEQPLVPLWIPFKVSFLHPSPLDGCLGLPQVGRTSGLGTESG